MPFLIRPSAHCALSKYGASKWTRGFLFYWFVGRLFTKVDMYGFSGFGHYRNLDPILEPYLEFEHIFYRVNRLVLDDESLPSYSNFSALAETRPRAAGRLAG